MYRETFLRLVSVTAVWNVTNAVFWIALSAGDISVTAGLVASIVTVLVEDVFRFPELSLT